MTAASRFCQKIGQPVRSSGTARYVPAPQSFDPAAPPRASWKIAFGDGAEIGLDDKTGDVFQYFAPNISNNFPPPESIPAKMPHDLALARAKTILELTHFVGALPDPGDEKTQYFGLDNHSISREPSWWFSWSPVLLASHPEALAKECNIVLDAASGYVLGIHVKIGKEAPPSEEDANFPAFLRTYLQRLPTERQNELYRYLGWGGDTPEDAAFWNALQDPEVIYRDARFAGEPYRPEALDALERALSTSRNKITSIKIAILLHRSGRRQGTDYLKTGSASDDSIDACAIFAQEQDREYLPTIVSMIAPDGKRRPSLSVSHDSFRALIAEMAQWRDPAVTKALRTRYQFSRQRYITDGLLGEALAANGVTDIAGDLRAASRSKFLMAEEKTQLEVALLKIQGVSHSQAIFLDLTARLKSKPAPIYYPFMDATVTEDARPTIIKSFVQCRIQESIPALREVVKNYLLHPVSTPPNPNADSPYQITSEERVASLAAQALVTLHDPQAGPLLRDLLTTMGLANVNQNELQDTARALMAANSSTDFLVKTMGKAWVNREKARLLLKPLPEYLLPLQPFNPYTKD
ncbi:hypothetical protein CCAX7_13330 [Capsulimonas corticalis]|uniref:Uncharacterized protein n=1 Tax=Capsulimonas corticalis TaxID=2219043 RepID=A0A402D4I4_9BACT|nr:hypothetical protein CCAX7_13330 [Capsulimonas corticalis]